MAESNESTPLSKAAEKYRELVSQRKRPKSEPEERLSLVLDEAPVADETPQAPVPPSLQPTPDVPPSSDSASAPADAVEQQDVQPEPHRAQREVSAEPAFQAPPAIQPVPASQHTPLRFSHPKKPGKVLPFAPRKKSKLSKSRRLQKHPWLS